MVLYPLSQILLPSQSLYFNFPDASYFSVTLLYFTSLAVLLFDQFLLSLYFVVVNGGQSLPLLIASQYPRRKCKLFLFYLYIFFFFVCWERGEDRRRLFGLYQLCLLLFWSYIL